ncbi:MAG: DUF3470 domain-containing protein [Rickettsiaceae bacterium H1]|nr:DUF3470 domain-containing protein [Rickettsiaceae bacterium H1]
MVHFVNEKCVKCKYTDCVPVCPVDCFHEGEEMLVIDSEVCIDCGACVQECPADAIIHHDTSVDGKSVECILNENDEKELSEVQKKAKKMLQFNSKYTQKWPLITVKKKPLPDAEKFKDKLDKFDYIYDNEKEKS